MHQLQRAFAVPLQAGHDLERPASLTHWRPAHSAPLEPESEDSLWIIRQGWLLWSSRVWSSRQAGQEQATLRSQGQMSGDRGSCSLAYSCGPEAPGQTCGC